jgi:hypothetical protein
MTKVGLKDTLALLAKGYSKKEIDALAAIDDESEQEKEQAAPAEDIKAQDDVAAEESNPEPDYKTMYEDLLKEKEAKEKEIEDKDNQIKEIQKDNIHEDNLPEIEKTYEEEQASLIDAIRSFY